MTDISMRCLPPCIQYDLLRRYCKPLNLQLQPSLRFVMFLKRYHSTATRDGAIPFVIVAREASPETSWNTTSATESTPEHTTSSDSTRIWVIVAAVAAILAFAACLVLVALAISKRRMIKKQLEEARSWDPFVGPKDVSRRRRMTAEDLVLEAESRREHIIRKSLASRSGRSTSSASSLGRPPFDPASMFEKAETGGGDGLKYDRKHLESRLSRHSSMPSLPRSKSPHAFPDLPPPILSRSLSPSRVPLLTSRTELPPLLEQHPCLR